MTSVSAPVREIAVAHSPDSDDAFMFYGLATNKVRVPGLRFTHTLCDIETLNQKAQEGVYDVTAVSFHAYPYIQDKYALMSCGGSVGDGYGPMIVSPRPFTQTEIKKIKIAIPGKLTTAYLALQALCPGHRSRGRPLRPDHPRKSSRAITKPDSSSTRASSPTARPDCSAWWTWENGGRKSPACPCRSAEMRSGERSVPKPMASVTQALRDSIQYAIDHREEALAYAMQFARDLDIQLADKFVGMYVNERTLDYGEDGREAVRRLLDMGHKAGIIPQTPRVEWV